MTGRLPRSRTSTRAIIAIVALYGLLLQGFVAAMLPHPAAASAAICAPAGESGPENGSAPVSQACCLAACLALQPVTPSAASLPVVWPALDARRIAWTSAQPFFATGPPRLAGSARGPPTN